MEQWVYRGELGGSTLPGMIGSGDRMRDGDFYLVWLYLLVPDTSEVFCCWGANNIQYVIELVEVVLSREDWPIGQHLCKDATH